MKKNLFKVLVILSLGGCTSNTVTSVNNLASLSKNYTTSLTEYLKETEETIINTESYSVMIDHRYNWDKNLLKESDSRIKNIFKSIDNIEANTDLLNKYFSNLNALLDNESNKIAADSLQRISTSLNGIEGVGPLANETLKTYNAYKVREIIKRDHAKIAKFLEINNSMLKSLNNSLDASLINNKKAKKYRVEKDFANKGKFLDSEWVKDRVDYIKLERAIAISSLPLKAGDDLAKAWDEVGKNNLEVEDLKELVKELQKFNKLISKLKMIN